MQTKNNPSFSIKEAVKSNNFKGCSEKEIADSLEAMVEKGILEKVTLVSGNTGYKLSDFGLAYRDHSVSHPKTRN